MNIVTSTLHREIHGVLMHSSDVRQGTHTAMKSGMLAAEAAFKALTDDTAASAAATAADMSTYGAEVKESWIWEELQQERNIRPGFAKLGLYGGMLHAAVDTLLLRGGAPWTFRHRLALGSVHTALGSLCGHHVLLAKSCIAGADELVFFSFQPCRSRDTRSSSQQQPYQLSAAGRGGIL